jgi:hypothetical protein
MFLTVIFGKALQDYGTRAGESRLFWRAERLAAG